MAADCKMLSDSEYADIEKEIKKNESQQDFLKRGIEALSYQAQLNNCDISIINELNRLKELYDSIDRIKNSLNERIQSHYRAVSGCIMDAEKSKTDKGKQISKDGKAGKSGKTGMDGKKGGTANSIGGRRARTC
jgi:hypothetical protein